MKRWIGILILGLAFVLCPSAKAQALTGYTLLTANVASTATSATDATCPVGNKCFYYLTAIYPLGESGPSTTTNALDVTTNGVKLTWTLPTTSGYTGFNIYRGIVGLPPSGTTATPQ